MQQLVLIIHVVIAISLVGLVLIQQGKGAEVGAAFGSGASQTVFGSQGSGSFLFKLTAGLAFAFFATSLMLTHMASSGAKPTSEFINAAAVPAAPKTPPVMDVPAPAVIPAPAINSSAAKPQTDKKPGNSNKN